MSLTDTRIRNAKPQEKPYKLFDGRGLYLLVHPNGSRYWRLRYRLGGKEKLHSIGVYPDVSLAEARELASDARKLARPGAVLQFWAMKPIAQTLKRKQLPGTFVFPEAALRAAKQKPFTFDIEALRRQGRTVLTQAELKAFKRPGPASPKALA